MGKVLALYSVLKMSLGCFTDASPRLANHYLEVPSLTMTPLCPMVRPLALIPTAVPAITRLDHGLPLLMPTQILPNPSAFNLQYLPSPCACAQDNAHIYGSLTDHLQGDALSPPEYRLSQLPASKTPCPFIDSATSPVLDLSFKRQETSFSDECNSPKSTINNHPCSNLNYHLNLQIPDDLSTVCHSGCNSETQTSPLVHRSKRSCSNKLKEYAPQLMDPVDVKCSLPSLCETPTASVCAPPLLPTFRPRTRHQTPVESCCNSYVLLNHPSGHLHVKEEPMDSVCEAIKKEPGLNECEDSAGLLGFSIRCPGDKTPSMHIPHHCQNLRQLDLVCLHDPGQPQSQTSPLCDSSSVSSGLGTTDAASDNDASAAGACPGGQSCKLKGTFKKDLLKRYCK